MKFKLTGLPAALLILTIMTIGMLLAACVIVSLWKLLLALLAS